jgi:hypothetical protein
MKTKLLLPAVLAIFGLGPGIAQAEPASAHPITIESEGVAAMPTPKWCRIRCNYRRCWEECFYGQ